jgi:tetratricopeptide (TPR) repeat protein
VNEFLKAKEINPALPEPYLGLGSVYKLQGRRAEAVAAFREYLKLAQDPNWRAQAEQSLRELGEKP